MDSPFSFLLQKINRGAQIFSYYENLVMRGSKIGSPARASVGGAQAIRRAMEVVRTVGQIQRAGASLRRVASATGLSTPTAYRILRSLTEERLLIFNDQERCYHIGPLAFELGLAALPDVRVHTPWQDAVGEVARRTRLTSYLIARSDDEAVCLFCAQGSTAIRAMPMEVGQRVPLGIGAGSMAILASLPDDEVQRILHAHEDRFAVFPGGKQPLDQILLRVSETRARGYSLSSGTVATGVIGLGVLVPADRGAFKGAITVSAVAETFDPAEASSLAATISTVIRRHG